MILSNSNQLGSILVSGTGTGGSAAPNILLSREMVNIPFTNGANDWQGRTPIVTLANGTHFMTWVEGTNHSDYNSASHTYNCCFWSSDFSVRSDNNEDLDGNPVSGFPLAAPASTGYVDGNLIACPNGTFILLVQNRGVNGSAWNGVNFTIRQYRGSSDCKSWAFELDFPTALGYSTVSQKASLQGFYENCVVGNDIFVPVTEIPVSLANTKVILAKSSDNGATWSVISDITALGEGVGSTNETAIIHLGGTRMGVVIRTETPTYNVSYYRESQDMGDTWSDLVDITPALGYVAVHQPSLLITGNTIILTGRRMASFASGPFERNGCWATSVSSPFNTGNTRDILLDPFNAGNGEVDINNGDSGYTRGVLNANGTITLFGYYGTAATARIYKYIVGHTDTPSIEKTSNNEYRFADTTGFRLPLNRDNVFIVGTPDYSPPVLTGTLGIIGRPYNVGSNGNIYWSCEGTNRPELWIDSSTGKGWAVFDGTTRIRSVTPIANDIFDAPFSGGVWLWPDDGQSTVETLIRDTSSGTSVITHAFQVFKNADGRGRVVYSIGGVSVTATTANVLWANGTAAQPGHLAWTLDGSIIRLYWNGVLQGYDGINTGDISGLNMASYSNATHQAHIGMRQVNTVGSWDLPYTGKMREAICQPGVWTADHILNNIMLL